MLKNTVIVIMSLVLLVLITSVTHLVIDNDVLYSLWCMGACVIGAIWFCKIRHFADWIIDCII